MIETRVYARAAGATNAQTEHLCDICLTRHEPHVACIKPANDGGDPPTQQKQATATQSRVASCRVLDDHAGDADCESDDSAEAGCCGQLASWFINAVTRKKRQKKRSAIWERTGLKGEHVSELAPTGAQCSWEPMSTASMLRGMRLADIVRAHVLMDDDGGVFLQQVLKDFKPKKVPGILYWLADTGSTCFVSDEPEHVLCAEECLMNITGVGATVCNLRSQLIITTMDTQGCYNTMQYGKCYNTKNGVGFPIASTGAMERNGCRFDINEERPQYHRGKTHDSASHGFIHRVSLHRGAREGSPIDRVARLVRETGAGFTPRQKSRHTFSRHTDDVPGGARGEADYRLCYVDPSWRSCSSMSGEQSLVVWQASAKK